MHHGKVYYFSIILFVLYLVWRTHFSSVYVYDRSDALEAWILFWLSIGYLIGSNLVPLMFKRMNYQYRKCLILLTIKILFASFLFWVDRDHFTEREIHELKLSTIFLEYSIYLGAVIYGIGLAGIMCLQGKYIGECATRGPVGDYFGITFFNMSLATLISFILVEGLFHT